MHKRTLLSLLFSCGLAVAAQAQSVQVSASPTAPTMSIRCQVSTASANKPLLVVDGVLVSDKQLNDLNPADIESISVLKNASATALYGCRAQQGVIIITTKSARRAAQKLNKLLIRPDEISQQPIGQ